MSNSYGMVDKPEVGMRVVDDLTHEVCTITRIEFDKQGNMGVYLDTKQEAYPGDDGGRFPWEISEAVAKSV